MFYVYSKSLITGKVNHGTQAFPKVEAQAYADELNNDPNYKGMLIHWVEAAEPRLQADLACAECNEYNGYHKTGCSNWLWQPSPSR